MIKLTDMNRAQLLEIKYQLDTHLRTATSDTDVEALKARRNEVLAQLKITPWPQPTRPQPTLRTIERWAWDGVARATDGCEVEPDGICPHGHPSWMIRLGVI